MVKILLIGNGAREHVIAETLKRSRFRPRIFSYMKANNPGIAKISEKVEIGKYEDMERILAFSKSVGPEFAFIGPDDPIANGVADELESIGIRSVAPKKKAAMLESSKSFARELLSKYGIPGNPRYKIFKPGTVREEIAVYLSNPFNFVVKPDGLTGGKGVKLQGEHLNTAAASIDYCMQVLETHPAVIVEEKLEGEEFSLQCLTDGTTVLMLPPVQDHKRAFLGDTGPNTGGMGSYSDSDHLLPFITHRDVDAAFNITRKVSAALHKETGEKFKGIMYGGWIATQDGVKLIEYNARFGDPEAMNVLPILKTDFVDVCRAIIGGSLDSLPLELEHKATVCKYIVPKGYPDEPKAGGRIEIGKVNPNVKMYGPSIWRFC